MRQFRLAGITCIDPRNYQKGSQRDFAKGKLVEQRDILKKIVLRSNTAKTSILLAPEKPTYSGNFSANIFMPIVTPKDSSFVIKFADQQLFDICAFMRDVCSGVLAIDDAISFIKDADLRNFVR